MLMLKIAGGLLLVFCGAMAGLSAAAREEKRLFMLTEYTVFLNRASAMISFSRAGICSILRDSSDLSLMQVLTGACLSGLESGEELSAAWEDAVDGAVKKRLISQEDRMIYLRFSQGFGETDADGEGSRLALCLEQAKQRREQLDAETEKNRRLYRLVGCFGGVLAAVLLM